VTVAGTGLALVTLIGVVIRPRSAVGSLLATGPMRWLGERSYSVYLWNDLARIAILTTLGRTLVADIVWIVLFVVLAETSFRFVERPLRAKYARRSGVSRTRRAGHSTAYAPDAGHSTAYAPDAAHTPPPAPPAKSDADTSPAAATDPPDRQDPTRHNGSPTDARSATTPRTPAPPHQPDHRV